MFPGYETEVALSEEVRRGQRSSQTPAAGFAQSGRFGDTEIGHLTPGEIVMPKSLLTPGLEAYLKGAFAKAGLDMGRYVVGGDDDSINPATGAREYFLDDLYKKLTDWHFEGRDSRNNTPLATYKHVTTPGTGWTKYPTNKNVFHQNGRGKPEEKYVHNDGHELIFDGETRELITDPKIKGTYNYSDGEKDPIKHGIYDIIPNFFGGNERGPN